MWEKFYQVSCDIKVKEWPKELTNTLVSCFIDKTLLTIDKLYKTCTVPTK